MLRDHFRSMHGRGIPGNPWQSLSVSASSERLASSEEYQASYKHSSGSTNSEESVDTDVPNNTTAKAT